MVCVHVTPRLHFLLPKDSVCQTSPPTTVDAGTGGSSEAGKIQLEKRQGTSKIVFFFELPLYNKKLELEFFFSYAGGSV